MITVCVNRADADELRLDNPEVHRLIHRIWQNAAHWLVDRYVLMPDHLHFFCSPGEMDYPLARWMSYWKRLVTTQWPEHRKNDGPVFQRDYWDRQIRYTESYDAAWEYVRENPVRAGLVQNPDDWPYQGEIHALRW